MFVLTMVPYYLFSNFHCFGMCGPIAALVGKHPFWKFYLIGRMVGFTMLCTFFALFGGMISWELGPFQGAFSILAGCWLVWISFFSIKSRKWSSGMQKWFLVLFSKNNPSTTWIVGLCTPLLPCGQSLMVFSFCALLGNPIQGFIQGFLFSLLTTPSLFLAIKGMNVLMKYKRVFDPLIKVTTVSVGILAVLRGLAELDAIPHYTAFADLHVMLW